MSVAGLMVLIALSLGILTFVAWPLITQSPESSKSQLISVNQIEAKGGKQQLSVLQSTYEQTLVTVRDLDFDFQTGKLADEDYRQQRAVLMVTAADMLRQIDLVKAEVAESAVAQRRLSRAIAQQAEAAITTQRDKIKTQKN